MIDKAKRALAALGRAAKSLRLKILPLSY